LTFDGDTNTGIYSPGADQLAISTNGTGRLFVDSAGKTTIGATSSSINILTLKLPAGNANQFTIANSDEATYGRLDIGHFTNGVFIGTYQGSNSTSDLIRFGTNGTERLRITSDGKLGLGTSNPSEKLTVSGNGNFSGAFIGTRDTGSNLIYNVFGNTPGSSYSVPRGIEFNVGAGAGVTTAAVITSLGAVGIGTNSVSNTLHIAKEANHGITLERTVSNPGSVILNVNSFGAASLTAANSVEITAAAGALTAFKIGSTEAARIDSSSRLLVGTSSSRASRIYYPGGDGAANPGLQLEATSTTSTLQVVSNTATVLGAAIVLGKSRGTSVGSITAVTDGDQLGTIQFNGIDVTTTGDLQSLSLIHI